MYELTQTIPIPSDLKSAPIKQYASYPFKKMNVGDSFTVPAEIGSKMKRAASVYGIRKNKKYAVRTQSDGTVVCWRIS
jgi:hypothetical protein